MLYVAVVGFLGSRHGGVSARLFAAVQGARSVSVNTRVFGGGRPGCTVVEVGG